MANRLKQLRFENNLTQKQICNELHLDQSAYSRIESGNRPLTEELINRAADFYHVSADYLLLRSEIRYLPDYGEFLRDFQKYYFQNGKNNKFNPNNAEDTPAPADTDPVPRIR
ncbi:MAG: helix-turn-helix transcriptional regulator [Lachnospiraceae bacterium]|nr:helix-turn-helix transcriptional regulator [Lachnospiraceae bacterium]